MSWWSHLKHDARRTPLSSVDCPVDCTLGRIDLRSRMGEWIRISRLWPVSLGVQFQLELFNFLHERAHCWRLFLSESRQSSFNASVLCQKVICRFWMKYVDGPGNVMISWYIHKTRGSSLSLFLLFFSSSSSRLFFFVVRYVSRGCVLSLETQSKEIRDYHTTSLPIRLIIRIYFENYSTACSVLAQGRCN